MNLKKLLKTYPELLKHMKDDGYTTEYIKRIEWEIKWLRRTRNRTGRPYFHQAAVCG